jgi:hypothetical protein
LLEKRDGNIWATPRELQRTGYARIERLKLPCQGDVPPVVEIQRRLVDDYAI